MYATLRTFGNKFVTSAPAPSLGIPRETSVGSTHLQQLSRLQRLHRLLHLEDRPRALYATRIHLDSRLFAHTGGGATGGCFTTWSVKPRGCLYFRNSSLVGLQSANQVTHLLVAIPLEDVRG